MGIARLFARDLDDLCRRLAEEYSLVAVTPTPIPSLWWEHVVRFIAWWPIKSLLFVVGLLAMFAAISAPGHGWPEGVALGAFGLVFFGSWLIGLADSMELVLFLLGTGLLAAELITPGFGLLGATGLALLGASLLLSFQTFLVPETPAQWAELRDNLGKTLLAFGLAVVGLAALLRFAPQLGRLGGLVHHDALPAPAPGPAEARVERLAPTGASGVAATVLKPAGKVRVEGETFPALAESGWVDEGAAVVVVGRRGGELIVAPRPEARGSEVVP